MDHKYSHNNPAFTSVQDDDRAAPQWSQNTGYGNHQNQYPWTIQQPPAAPVYTVQPQFNQMTVERQETVPDYYSFSIFVTLCCCLPLGLFAVFKAREARELVRQGRFPDARAASQQAKTLSIVGLIIGILVILAIIGVLVWWFVFAQETVTYFYRY